MGMSLNSCVSCHWQLMLFLHARHGSALDTFSELQLLMVDRQQDLNMQLSSPTLYQLHLGQLKMAQSVSYIIIICRFLLFYKMLNITKLYIMVKLILGIFTILWSLNSQFL